MDSGRGSRRAKTIQQDLGFVVSVLLLLAVIEAAITGLAADEDEFFGFGDDLHGFAGWSIVVLTGAHILLRANRMIGYARRRMRRLLGVGAVVRSGFDSGPGAD